MTTTEQRDEVQAVLAGIDDLLPTLRKRAQETEDLRRLPDATVAELQEIGFFKLLQPSQWGGYETAPTTFYEAVRRLGSACGSTGWVGSSPKVVASPDMTSIGISCWEADTSAIEPCMRQTPAWISTACGLPV